MYLTKHISPRQAENPEQFLRLKSFQHSRKLSGEQSFKHWSEPAASLGAQKAPQNFWESTGPLSGLECRNWEYKFRNRSDARVLFGIALRKSHDRPACPGCRYKLILTMWEPCIT